jgi:hypothetical protein
LAIHRGFNDTFCRFDPRFRCEAVAGLAETGRGQRPQLQQNAPQSGLPAMG